MNQPQPIFDIRKLNAWHGDQRILRDIDLEVPEHRVTAIIGPSGCGKSTLVRCLNRLHEETPGTRSAGQIFLDGVDIRGEATDPVMLRRQVGMVFQKPSPFPLLSIYENVAAGLKLAGLRSRPALDEAVESSLRQAALWDEVKDKLKAPGLSLSGGQQQRLCIARALAVKPRVLLMDEPTSALDPISTARIEELLLELRKSVTIVIVTHNLQQAGRISDQTVFLLSGELVEYGPTPGLFRAPRDERTQRYLSGRFG